MKINRLTSLLVLAALAFTTGYSQELQGNAAGGKLSGASRIRMNEAGTAPVFILFDPSKAPTAEELKPALFGSRPEDAFMEIRSESDDAAMVHTRFQQQYKNVNVDGNVYIFHSRNGKVVSANGYFFPNPDLSVIPAFSEEQVLDYALNGMKQKLSKESIESSTVELVVCLQDKKAVLAYKCGVISNHPLVNQLVYVDAQTGTVLREVSRLCAIDVPGTAHTQFSGNQPIVTDGLSPTNFLLRESGRGNGIETYNSATSDFYTDTDNDWNNINGSQDQFATDVHFGAEATYDFFMDHFGRNSFDGQGSTIRSFVNDEGVGVNAYWSGGGDNTMHYGNGDENYFPVASLEVAGHELSHGVTEYSAGLEYQGESGALNESFSDIFGNTIRFLSAPAQASWFIGDQILRPGGSGDAAFRNMSNPNEFMNPDTYGGLYFNTGDIVHYDSGIQNFWYYLLVEGGNGTNDIGDAYTVNAIGLTDAMKIAYRNLAFYLTPTSTFADARDGAEQAAIDLFGVCSPQHLETIHAWYAVGVGSETPGNVEASFTSTNNFGCTAPLTASFTPDHSYPVYSWNFGDGSPLSTSPNPTHTYTAAGNYTVTLIVSNNSGCMDTDTIAVENAVIIGAVDPIADFSVASVLLANEVAYFTDESLYGATAWEWNFGDGGTSTDQNPVHTFAVSGVYNVSLTVHNCHGTDVIVIPVEVSDYIIFCDVPETNRASGVIYDSGGENGTYYDNEYCTLLIDPCNAQSITLTMDELELEFGFDYLTVYDGDNPNGMPIATFNGTSLQQPVTAVSGKMYLLFTSDVSYVQSGFRMSYTSNIITPNSSSGAFTASATSPVAGETVFFTNQSAGHPVSWLWNFGDGGTSTEPNPMHVFAAQGNYTVTLTVTYCNGFTDVATHTYVVQSVGIGELSAAEHLLTVSPNPFRSEFVVAAGEIVQHMKLKIVDLSGRTVYTQDENGLITEGIVVTPGALSAGQYLLEASYERMNGTAAFERCRIQVVR